MEFIMPFGDMIELGCHAGFNLIHYAAMGYRITGVDVSDSLINLARTKIIKEKPEVRERIRLIRSFIENLPDSFNESYDTIILTETLEHVQEPKAVLLKAKSLMRKKAQIYISVPSRRWGNYSHIRGFDVEQLKDILIKTGFTINKIYRKDITTYAIASKNNRYYSP